MLEELFDQVSQMLVKKIYGCHTIDDFRKKAEAPARKRAKARYSRLSDAATQARAAGRRPSRASSG